MSRVTNKLKRNRGCNQLPVMEKNQEVCVLAQQSGKVIVYGCGHRAREHYTCLLGGEVNDSDTSKNTALCGACFLKCIRSASGQCSLCGGVILPGDPFGYDYKMNETQERKFPASSFVCCRIGCCSTGHMAGTWTARRLMIAPKVVKLILRGGSTIHWVRRK